MQIQVIVMGWFLCAAVTTAVTTAAATTAPASGTQDDRVAPASTSEAQSSAAADTPAPAEPWQLCVRELCGDELGRLRNELRTYLTYHDERLAKNYEPLIKAVAASARAELIGTVIEIENLLLLIRENRKITSPRALQLNEITLSTEHIDKVVANPDLSIDEEATRKALADQSPETISLNLRGARVAFNAVKAIPIVAKESLVVLRQRISDEEIRMQIRVAIADVENNEKQVANHFHLPREAIFPGLSRWEEYKKRLISEPLSAYNLEQLSDRYQNPLILARMISEFELDRQRNPLEARALMAPELVKSYEEQLKSIKEYLSGKFDDSNLTTASLKSAMYVCLGGAALVEMYSPTQENIEAFKPLESLWRKAFLERLGGHLSIETMSKFTPFFNGLKIDFPKTKADWLKDALRDLQRAQAEAKWNWVNQSNESRQLAVIQMQFAGRSAVTEIKPMKSTEEHCKRLGNPVSDEADMSSDQVSFGALTIARPSSGGVVAFHEYAHSLSGFLRRSNGVSPHSKGVFSRWRSCLINGRDNGARFIEEDFADLLAFNLSKSKFNHIGCIDLDDKDVENFTVTQTPKKDEHSSDLFRLLHSEMVSGKVPEVCTQALKAKGETFEMVNCFEAK